MIAIENDFPPGSEGIVRDEDLVLMIKERI